MSLYWLVLLFLSSYFPCLGQISGIVKDAKTDKPLEGVEVFLDQHTGISLTNVEGHFELTEAVSGFVTVSLYKSGYELYHSSMRIQPGKAYKLNLTLTPEKRRESGSVRQTFSDDIQTGYRIVTYENQSVRRKKLTRFELLSDMNVQQQIEWEKKRKEVYEGSLRHWLTALVRGTSIAEGFEMYVEGEQVAPETLLAKTSLPDYFRLQLAKPLEVKYREYSNRLTASGTLDVSERGVLLNDDLLKIEGPMSVQRLPLNYVPFAGDIEAAYEETIRRYYEKVYVHTDKPYYYQGEPMWFKAYLNYYDLSMRDSLSKVLYVELISPEKEIVLEKMLKIDSGMAHGDFILPDTLRRGDYFLRAYTNLQRNFGDENLYVKHIRILGITDKVDPTQAEWKPKSEGRVKITTDKEKYGTREKIALRIDVSDQDGNPIDAEVSISVTDASQVVPISIPSISDAYKIENQGKMPKDFLYPTENGVTMEGTYYSKEAKIAKTLLNLIQWQSNATAIVETNEEGRFTVSGFDFYDSTRIFYSVNPDKKDVGKVILNERNRPRVEANETAVRPIEWLTTESPQRIISEYEVPKEARLLEGIEIRSTKIQEIDRAERPFGRPDYILTANEMNYASGNLINTILAKVPGMRAYEYVDSRGKSSWKLGFSRSIGLTATSSDEPLLLINDVPVGGKAGEVIADLDPNTVESIEFTSRINVLYGSQGVNGVISIRTKTGPKALTTSIQTADYVTIGGYAKPRVFTSPQYDIPAKTHAADYRSLIFWDPRLSIENHDKTISFYAADLETVYRVELAGVTERNEPIYATYFIKVEND